MLSSLFPVAPSWGWRGFLFCGPAFELATDAEQRYLIAIANLGDGPYKTADAARTAGYSNMGGASVVREELIEKELIWSPRRGQIDFTVPRFAQYLRATPCVGLQRADPDLLSEAVSWVDGLHEDHGASRPDGWCSVHPWFADPGLHRGRHGRRGYERSGDPRGLPGS